MVTTRRRSIAPPLYLVTGGAGYVGYRLGLALAARGACVRLFDIRPPPAHLGALPAGIEFIVGDLRRFADVDAAAGGVCAVFHVASYGMSGSEQLRPQLIHDVNCGGTDAVIQACLRNGVPRLVYTSTYNVVFGGQSITAGDETLPYWPLHLHPDRYSPTKALAERSVLAANGTPLRNGKGHLRTCALRSAGIYGPGEQRHLPRVVRFIEKGLFAFTFGDPKGKVDFVHVDNLVQAHMLAAEALGESAGHVAAGQAYHISDGRPINNFEFFRPLVEGLGYPFPRLRVPLRMMYGLAAATETAHRLLNGLVPFEPFLTRAEVLKSGVNHWFVMDKAKAQLGYQPQDFDFDDIVDWFRQRGAGRALPAYKRPERGFIVVPSAGWWLLALLVLLAAVLVSAAAALRVG